MVVSVEDVVDMLGIADPSAAQEARIEEELLAAHADIEDYLNRPLIPVVVTRAGMWKDPRYDEMDWRAWPWAVDDYDDDVVVLDATVSSDGSWTVELRIGFDGPGTPGVARYVKSHVREALTADPEFTAVGRKVRSVSAEGQSISYDTGSGAHGAAGSTGSLESLRRHRRYSAHRAPSRTTI
ncbi:MAG: hypothetical protein ACRCYR_03760 [Phycicoccus sp.]